MNIGTAITSTGGRSIVAQDRTAGAVTFSGPVVDTGAGILLDSNTGSTIAFAGGVAISTDNADGFTATAAAP
jgi:hypothetical protein